MGSGLSECVSVMGLMLLMQFHLVVLFFFLFVCLSVSPPAFRGSLPSLPRYPPLPSLKWD